MDPLGNQNDRFPSNPGAAFSRPLVISPHPDHPRGYAAYRIYSSPTPELCACGSQFTSYSSSHVMILRAIVRPSVSVSLECLHPIYQSHPVIATGAWRSGCGYYSCDFFCKRAVRV